jgi:hypothetical protein
MKISLAHVKAEASSVEEEGLQQVEDKKGKKKS